MSFVPKRPLAHAALAQAAIDLIVNGTTVAQGPKAAQARPAVAGALRWPGPCARPVHSPGALAGLYAWNAERNQPQRLAEHALAAAFLIARHG